MKIVKIMEHNPKMPIERKTLDGIEFPSIINGLRRTLFQAWIALQSQCSGDEPLGGFDRS